MTTPPAPEGEPGGDAPFLPPAGPVVPIAAPTATAEVPTLPSSRPPEPAASSANPSVPSQSAFDAKAMVESQKHYNANPTYGAMPAGTDESRAAARKLREQANRKRRRGKAAGRILLALFVAAAAVGAYFAYQAIQDDPPPADGRGDGDAATGDGGALTPLGEQQQVIEALDDVNSGATPSAGALLDAVDDARDVVGQADPPVGGDATLLVADLLTPVVLDHTEVLTPADGYERFVVRAGDLLAADPNAHAVLVERLLALPQAVAGEPQLAVVPVVPPGDIGIAVQRDGDTITRIVAVAADPAIRSVGP